MEIHRLKSVLLKSKINIIDNMVLDALSMSHFWYMAKARDDPIIALIVPARKKRGLMGDLSSGG